MVFSNLLFIFLFLPLNLIFYFLAKDIRTKNAVLLIFSLFFYAWGEPKYVLLLVFMALADYFFARLVGKYRGVNDKKAKAALFGAEAAAKEPPAAPVPLLAPAVLPPIRIFSFPEEPPAGAADGTGILAPHA